jgi:hypothetical protein
MAENVNYLFLINEKFESITEDAKDVSPATYVDALDMQANALIKILEGSTKPEHISRSRNKLHNILKDLEDYGVKMKRTSAEDAAHAFTAAAEVAIALRDTAKMKGQRAFLDKKARGYAKEAEKMLKIAATNVRRYV